MPEQGTAAGKLQMKGNTLKILSLHAVICKEQQKFMLNPHL